MKNFKPGQEVVYRELRQHKDAIDITPKDNETVTIECACTLYPNSWILVGFTKNRNGGAQSFSEDLLFPIQSQKIPLELHKIKLEPKKVLEQEIIYAQ